MSGERNHTTPLLKALLSQEFGSRRGADFLQSDGSTTNRRIETVYGTVGAVAGSDLTEVDYVFDVPTSNPGATAYVFAWSSSQSSGSPAHSLGCYLFTNGGLYIDAYGASTSFDSRSFGFAGFRAAYSGRRVRLTVAFSGDSTTNPIVWLDGLDISSYFTAAAPTGTNPKWVNTSLVTTYHLAGHTWPAGYFRPGRPVNRKYAQADVDFVQLTGRLPATDALGGSMVPVYTSNFATGDGWANDSVGIYPNTDTAADGVGVPPSDDWLKLQHAVAPRSLYGYRLNVNPPRAANLYQRVTGDVFIPATSAITHVLVGQINGTVAAGTAQVFAVTPGTTTSVDARFLGSVGSAFWVTATNAAGAPALVANTDALYLKNFKSYSTGALSDPIIQPIPVVGDATPNGIGSLVVGFEPITQSKDWMIQTRTTTSGNQQVLGGAVLFTASDARKVILDSWHINNQGTTRTVSLGATSGGANYLSGGSAAAGASMVTLVTRISAGSALWVNSNGTDELRHTIRGHVGN